MATDNERAVIGDNQPPEPTALERETEALSDLELEASHWLDGAEVENQAQADEVARLKDMAVKAKSRADSAHKAEKQPHLDAGRKVDADWKPIKDGADRVKQFAQAAITPWLIRQEREKREREDAARRVAEEAAAEARRLAAEADGSLAAVKARDAAIEEAARAEAAVARAANAKTSAKGGGMVRAVSLRTTWRAEVLDRRALLNHVAKTDPGALDAFLTEWAGAAVRVGGREIPGVRAYEERVAA